jgi:uncharacterized protein with FMN-binding domain
MPKRGAVALGLTGLALVLLLNFHTPEAGDPTMLAAGNGSTSADGSTPVNGSAGTTTTGGSSSASGSSGSSDSTDSSGTRTVDGSAVDTRYGTVQVEITVSNGQLTDVVALQLPDGDRRSASISSRAEPMLRSEALSAQSASIDGVSGATYTSDGYARSLQAALDAAGI